jgi:serine/threonine-protein kinase
MILLSAGALSAADCAPGTITTIAGGGSGDGSPALNARFHDINDVARGRDGSLYICDGHRVRRVDRGGIVTAFAGTGAAAYAGDGGPARQAALNAPQSVAVGADGSVYIADAMNHRIRKVDQAGVITTIAGDGEGRFAGDGGRAVKASLHRPWGLSFGPDGSLYIADSWNNRARRIDAIDGRITPGSIIATVAGNGEREYAGDGGPATEAALHNPRAVAVAGDGTLYIAEPPGATGGQGGHHYDLRRHRRVPV